METLACNFHSFTFNLSNSQTLSFLKFPLHQVRYSITPATTLSLRMAHSHSSQNPVIEQQRVIIPNKHGEKLVGLLHETGSKEIVILCHGFRSTKADRTMVNLAVALEKEGISAFRFDFAGNGTRITVYAHTFENMISKYASIRLSSGLTFSYVSLRSPDYLHNFAAFHIITCDFPHFRESEGSFEFGNYSKEADDLHSVIQHFCEANRIVCAILGHSKGGDVVLLYASKYHDIHTVVNVSGRYDLKKGIEERFGKDFMDRIQDGFVDIKNKKGVEYRVTKESLMERLSLDMHEACLKIPRECRVLTVHGSADEIIPVGDALEFAKIIPNHKLHIVEGANHNYTSYQTELASVVLNYLKETLQQD
ncbi:hypothetical protein CXB51_013309 [Gossypium anomalum]|uniref:Peptidase S9 prolyl oligopeptidase catalytic domain-containing protein n=1 Tax=Gossypium anomalum TaxID=47600 RepID=A0A8J5ZCT7_9ROSI|nr:hypothetical protein CXB51_013309 [Gossypium anomalum]